MYNFGACFSEHDLNFVTHACTKYHRGRSYRRCAGTTVGGAAAPVSSDNMATPSELSLEEIRKYLLENGGTARNHEVVKYFKKFLTDPETRGTSKYQRGI